MEDKNFLDVLQEEIEKLVQDGLITEEDLRRGFYVPFESFIFSDVNRETLSRSMASVIKERNPSYESNGDFRGYNPDRISKFAIRKTNQGNIIIQVDGKDGWSKFFITNQKDENSNILELSPDEFIDRYVQEEGSKIKSKLKTNTGCTEEEIIEIMKLTFNEQKRKVLTKGLKISFREMMDNFIEYYRFNIDPNFEQRYGYEGIANQRIEQPEPENGIRALRAGIIEQRNDTNTNRGPVINPTKPRKSDIYSFDERKEILEDLKPECFVPIYAKKDGRQELAYKTYIYPNPNGREGYLLFSEPVDGDKESRAVYLSNERLGEFLLDGQEFDDETKIEIAEYFLYMSRGEFAREDFAYSFHHTDLEVYREKLNQIIGGKTSISNSIKNSANRVSKILYEGMVRQTQIKNTSNGVTEQQMNDAKAVLDGALLKQSRGDTTKVQGGEQL